jgi:hypothetical protein
MMPHNYERVNRFLESARVRIIYEKNPVSAKDGLQSLRKHCSYKSSRGEYRVYIDESLTDPEYMAADLFEKGRILFGHLEENAEERADARASFERALLAKRSTLLALLPDDAGKRISFYTTCLWKQFLETAQAVEIETKLFDNAAFAEKFALKPGLNWKSYLRLLAENPAFFVPLIAGRKGDFLQANEPFWYRENAPQNSEKWGRTLHQMEPEPDRNHAAVTASIKELPEILRERSLRAKKIKMTNDVFYYENRNKYNTGLLVPRRQKQEKLDTGNVVILLDVSGSIPAAFTEAAVNAVIEAQTAFDAENSRLVRWSANLVDDTDIFDIKPVSGGGGTLLADGIEYCKKYANDDSAFFIISDLQDEIADWIKNAQAMNARKTVIAYNKTGEPMSVEKWFSRVGSNADYRKEEVSLAEWSRHFDTFLAVP